MKIVHIRDFVLIVATLALFLCSYHGDCSMYTIQQNDFQVNSLHVIALLSTSSDAETDIPKSERNTEILPGGILAVDEINNNTELLYEYRLELVPLLIPMCDPIQGMSDFVDAFLSSEYSIIGVTGLFCRTRLSDYVSGLAGHNGIDLITLSGSTTYCHKDHSHHELKQHLYYMLPSSKIYGRALIGLMQELGWSRIGVIYHQGFYYQKTIESFSSLISEQNLSIDIVFSDEVSDSSNVMRVLHNLRESGAKIVFALLPPKLGAKLMCQAFVEDFGWPNYAWIFAEFETDNFELCNESAIENVFVLTQVFESSNIYSNVLHDSVMALALAVNSSIEEFRFQNLSLSDDQQESRHKISRIIDNELQKLSFEGLTGEVSFAQSGQNGLDIPIHIFQIRSGVYIQIGLVYSQDNESLWNTSTIVSSEVPSDELEQVFVIDPLPLFVLLYIAIAICFLVTTLLLFLFFFFRNEPEIKASSYSLSICIFIGCYSILMASLLQTITNGHIIAVDENKILPFSCQVTISLSTAGIDLLLATLIAKTLRIHHIFNNTGKLGKIWTDKMLLLLIIIITSIKVAILIIWSAVDPFHVVNKTTLKTDTKPPYYETVQSCYSRYTGVWLLFGFGYTGILFATLIVLAIKTRKIYRSDFKDTKKINALIMALLMDICVGGTLWGVLRLVNNSKSDIVVSLAYLLAAILVILFLFVPKVSPPIWRHVSKRVDHFTSKLSSTDPQSTYSTQTQLVEN